MPVKKGAPKKRGRKPKKKAVIEKPPPKKRGRKPKGGKIIKKNDKIKSSIEKTQPNIILHLKCSTKDINNNAFNAPNYTPNILDPQAYNIITNTKMYNLQYEEIKHSQLNNAKSQVIKNTSSSPSTTETNNKLENKKIWRKLNLLKNNLRCNNVSDKRSACFWCTYEFDNPAVYIPKHYNDQTLEVYGCFCSPECALAYLKNEQIDDSTKWERYALLNNVYSKIYDYNKNIKPAPNPHYTLDKYYGVLNINEYRKLLNNERILMVVDKPMTKILPELYEENNEMPDVYSNMLSISEKTDKNSTFRLKRSQTKKTKTNALSSTFNL